MFRPLLLSASLLSLAALAPAGLANGWQKLTNAPPFNASTMFLLMDGRVLVNEWWSVHWWILTPDASGSYLNGTWTQAADSHDDRLYYASNLLPNGRVLVAGGEYSHTGGSDKAESYDPVQDKWTRRATPSGWGYIGDAPAILLADGRYMLGNISDGRTACFDPKTASWTATATKLNGSCVEETWVLLADGTVVAPDCIGHPGSELYDPAVDAWISLGPTAIDLVDSGLEIGPGLTLYDGNAFVVGATPHSCHYTPSSTPGGVGTWTQGGDPPVIGGSRVSAVDAPCAILPSGNVLCALGHGFNAPTYFFEYDGTNFIRIVDPGNSGGIPYEGRMLPLPTGEVLFANQSIYLYTADGGPDPSWLPTITSVATDLIPGENYVLSGTLLNGWTMGNSYGDECGVQTNYPIIRLTYAASGHVVYCRTYNRSTCAIATGSTIITTPFEVPATAELGAATLEVVANGLASAGQSVVVRPAIHIDFDALATGVVVTNQYADATFSAPAGFANWTTAVNAGTSQPNVIMTGPAGGGSDGLEETDVDFPCPVASLTFEGVSIDGTGTVASVNVFESGVLTATVPVEGGGDPATPVRVDLTSYKSVTRIEIVGITDAGGIGWDDFDFCLASSASWSNYGSGFPGTLGVPSLTSESNPIIGTSVTLDLGNSLGATTPALLMTGVQQAVIPTSKGGDLLLVPLLFQPLSVPSTGMTLSGSVPNDPSLCGLAAFVQALEIDAGAAKGVSFTAGLQLTVGY